LDHTTVSSVLEGINGCVMCYGQTGAGKTHTLGNVAAGSEGIVWRALSQILSEASASGASCDVKFSYVQIYMENLYDLLDPESNVDLREDPKEGVVLSGASSTSLASIEDAVATIERANRNRATASTAMNDASSRSHSVLILDVTTRSGSRILKGKLHLVDLAGSERVKKSEVQGQAFDEAIAINNSLTTLGRCVQALAAGPKGGKAPFRETKLTRLLSSAFGGSAKTVLVVCVAPTASDSFETVNSLQFGQQAMSVKVQAKVNSTVDYAALEEELWWKVYEAQQPRARAEMAAWKAVRPVYESQEALRVALSRETERVETVKLELEALRQRNAEAQAAISGKLARKKQEHERKMKAMRKQQAASAAELERLRALATSAGVTLPQQAPSLSAGTATVAPATSAGTSSDTSGGSGTGSAAAAAGDPASGHQSACEGADASTSAADAAAAMDEAARFGGSSRLAGLKTLDGVGALDTAALEMAARAAMGGSATGRSTPSPRDEEGGKVTGAEEPDQAELAQTVGKYQTAVERAWADVQRLEDEKQQVTSLERASEEEAQRLEAEREDMEATLHEVASDLGRLALLYRTQGKAPHAVPLYMTALAIYEKTLGPDHPEVAKDLVNLGNAFCDQGQHSEAVPLYLRALAIDQAALGDDHPEVAMDLSNLGIVYRVQGRRDEAIALFQRAHSIMADALGPNDPKTLTVARNLSATQVIEVTVNESPRAPPAALAQRLSTPRGGRKTSEEVAENLQAATEKRDAVLNARVERAAELRTPRGGQSSNVPSDGAVDVSDSGGGGAAGETSGQTGSANGGGGSAGEVSHEGVAMPKLKLNMKPQSNAADPPAPATPRSTYARTTKEAQAASQDAGKGGKASGRSMLHKHVANFDFGAATPSQ
jgi:tetratricopeptide (TPR) repeat protein